MDETIAEPTVLEAPPRRRRITSIPTFAAFQIPAFRLLWANSFSFALIQSTTRFAYVWLVLELGGGARASGLITFALGVPTLFIALPAGVMADRIDRRRLMAASQIGATAVTALTAILVWTHLATVPVVFALSIALGTTMAFGMPVRQAVTPSIVPQDKLMNAIVLQSFVMNVTMIVGPALGGAIIAASGLGGAFGAATIIYVVGLLFLIPLRLPAVAAQRDGRGGVREGLSFVWTHPGIRTLIALMGLSGIVMMGPFMALLPMIARDVLHRDALEASLMFSVLGAGMFAGTVLLASIGNIERRGMWLLINMIPGGLLWAGIGLSRSYVLTMAIMFAWGVGGAFFMNLTQTLVQSNTPQEFMGRVMAVWTLVFMGVAPLGSLLAGAGAGWIGAPAWIAIGGALQSAIAIAMLVTQPGLREMR